MFININERRINVDHITEYGTHFNGNIYIEVRGIDTLIINSKEVDVQKTLLQLDRILNLKHIDIFEVKK